MLCASFSVLVELSKNQFRLELSWVILESHISRFKLMRLSRITQLKSIHFLLPAAESRTRMSECVSEREKERVSKGVRHSHMSVYSQCFKMKPLVFIVPSQPPESASFF